MAGRLRAKQIGVLRPGRHGDGGTLFIVVEPGGRSRHWVQRLTVDGKRRDLGLGGYPYVGLAEARAAAFANRQLARRGGDPMAAVRQSRLPTFRTACERVDAAATWKGDGAKNRRSALERYCGSILDRGIDQIRRAHVIAILAPILAEKPATGSKLHGWIRGALAWGVAREYMEFNVADGIGAALPSARKAKHHAALPYSEVGTALDAIANSGARDTVKACLRFVILTAVRSGEARGAKWSEINLQAAEWRIPAERMKGGCEHRVPLSRAAIDTLEAVRSLHSPAGWCFPSPTRAVKEIQVSTLAGNGKQKRDPRGHVKRDPPVSVNSSVHDLLPWRLFRGCSDLADGLTLAVHIVTCALRSHSRARRVRLSADAPGGVRNRPP